MINFEVSNRNIHLEDEEIINLISKPLGNSLMSAYQLEQAQISQQRHQTLLKISSKLQKILKIE